MPPAEVFRSLIVFDDNHPLFGTYKVAKRIVIGVVGGTVLIMGVVMMVTPGPGIAGILLGLGILGIEFAWARIWLKRIKTKGQDVVRVLRNKKDDPPRDIS
jgi:tellurite resistance protein TerC